MIRPDLRNLTNRHKPIEGLNTTSTNNDNNSNNNDTDNDNNTTDRGEWKIMLRMYIKYIFTKCFDETYTIHPKSKQVEFYMGSNTENVINTLFNTVLQSFQRIQETSYERRSKFIPKNAELLEYERHKIGIISAELYIVSPNWIANKKAATNPKNKKDNKCFQWSIIPGLNYNTIEEKELKKF